MYPRIRRQGRRTHGDRRHRRLRARRAGAVLRHRRDVPAARPARPRGWSRSSSTFSTCCGIPGCRSATPPARSTTACAWPRSDLTIRTSLLEARWLWGDEALFATFEQRFRIDVVAGSGAAFVEQKLAERDARHERMGDSRYVLEPQHQGRQGRPARSADAVLDRQVSLPGQGDGRAGRARRVHRRRRPPVPPRRELPVDGALPPALRRRPPRGAPDLQRPGE